MTKSPKQPPDNIIAAFASTDLTVILRGYVHGLSEVGWAKRDNVCGRMRKKLIEVAGKSDAIQLKAAAYETILIWGYSLGARAPVAEATMELLPRAKVVDLTLALVIAKYGAAHLKNPTTRQAAEVESAAMLAASLKQKAAAMASLRLGAATRLETFDDVIKWLNRPQTTPPDLGFDL